MASLPWHGRRCGNNLFLSEQQSMSSVINGIIVGGLVTAVAIAIAFVRVHRHLGKNRGVSREEFIGVFADTAISADIPGAVYDFYKARVLSNKFSLAPDDDYEIAFCEGDEDIDDDARLLMKTLGLRPPSEEVRLQWAEQMLAARQKPPVTVTLTADSSRWMQPIQTVRDMVLWLEWIRQHQ
jgi:hypothetical protein